jgi:hypothetical protein
LIEIIRQPAFFWGERARQVVSLAKWSWPIVVTVNYYLTNTDHLASSRNCQKMTHWDPDELSPAVRVELVSEIRPYENSYPRAQVSSRQLPSFVFIKLKHEVLESLFILPKSAKVLS